VYEKTSLGFDNHVSSIARRKRTLLVALLSSFFVVLPSIIESSSSSEILMEIPFQDKYPGVFFIHFVKT